VGTTVVLLLLIIVVAATNSNADIVVVSFHLNMHYTFANDCLCIMLPLLRFVVDNLM
jgi:hypothetical protein